MKRTISAVLIAALLAGCASTRSGANWQPVIDTKGRDATALQTDITECQAYARQLADAADSAATGAIAGAIFGALVMAAAGGNAFDRRSGAWMGALGGATGAGVKAETDQRTLISRCLAGRGHAVLN